MPLSDENRPVDRLTRIGEVKRFTGAAMPENPSTIPDPFGDLSALRLDQSYAETAGVKKLLTTVPVRKPSRQDFVRVHPDPAYRLTPAATIEASRRVLRRRCWSPSPRAPA